MASSMRIDQTPSPARRWRVALLMGAGLMLAAGPALAQPLEAQPPQAEPNEAQDEEKAPDATPRIPLIDDAGPLPDIGETAEFNPDDEAIVLPAEPFTPAPVDARGRSVYGLFLAGRAAMARGYVETGAAYLADGQALDPTRQRLRDQAFTSALLAGDMTVAARIAPTEGGSTTVQAGRLAVVVNELSHGQAAEANAELAATPITFPHARAGLMVQPWIAAAAGDWGRALASAPSGADPISIAFVSYHRALLLERRRDYAGAEAEFRALDQDPRTAGLFRAAFGEFLERRGRRADALALYDAALAAGAQDMATIEARARVLARGKPPAQVSFIEGAAGGLDAAAAAALAEQVNEFAVVYLRLSLGLKPDDDTRLLLGQALQAAGMKTAAREALALVGQADPRVFAAARQQMAWSYQEDDQPAAALEAAHQALAALPDEPSLLYSLASLLMAQDRYEEALTILNGPEINTAQQAWQVRFQRGAAYESLGRIAEAEAELWAALQAQPESPEVLNYLGYLWVDSGLRVHEGAEMIARAAEAAPDNGHIQDSLGWAQYRQGLFEQAVDTLEKAIALEPGVAEINDHLGDAYWQVGRRREAGFQWNRVLTLDDADDAMRERVEAKIAGGLNAAADGAAI